MAPPPSTVVSPVVSLLVRLLTCVCLLISIILLVTNTATLSGSDYDGAKLKFSDFYAFRYHLGAAVIGLAYSLMQAALNVLLVSTGNRIGGDSMLNFDFFADKVVSYLLATAAATSFGLAVDNKRTSTEDLDKFLRMAEASASVCLLAFLFSAISSIFSSFSLPKRVN